MAVCVSVFDRFRLFCGGDEVEKEKVGPSGFSLGLIIIWPN